MLYHYMLVVLYALYTNMLHELYMNLLYALYMNLVFALYMNVVYVLYKNTFYVLTISCACRTIYWSMMLYFIIYLFYYTNIFSIVWSLNTGTYEMNEQEHVFLIVSLTSLQYNCIHDIIFKSTAYQVTMCEKIKKKYQYESSISSVLL